MSPTAQQNCVGTYYLPISYLSNGLFEAPTHWSQNKKLVVVRRIRAAQVMRACMRRRDSKHHRTGRKVAAAADSAIA